MIDYEKLELLLQKTPIVVRAGEKIGAEFWEWYSKKKPCPSNLVKLFEGGDWRNPITYDVLLRCDQCSAETTIQMSKSRLLTYLNARSNSKKYSAPVVCEKCAECQKKEEEARSIAWNAEQRGRDQRIMENMRSTEKLTREEFSYPDQHLAALDHRFSDEAIKSVFRTMKYRDFLQTKYWRLVSLSVKNTYHRRCALCNSKEHLNTHHRSYEFRGLDHTWKGRKNLISLCEKCHTKHHKVDEPICRD